MFALDREPLTDLTRYKECLRKLERIVGPVGHQRESKVGSAEDRAVSVDFKPDTLGERKFTAEIDGAGDAAHIGLPRVRACLAPAAGFLFAAECAADFRAGRADVGIGDPAV